MRRCTQGISLLCLVLVSVSLVLDDLSILLAAAILAAGIAGQYVLFGYRMREMVSSIQFHRTLSRDQVRRGMAVDVTTTVAFQVPPRMKVKISDLYPSQTNFVNGVTEITAWTDPAVQSCTFNYTIVPVIHGSHPFSGIRVDLRDLFFEDTMTLSRESDCRPVLLVQPTGLFAPPNSDMGDGMLDLRKSSTWSGADVHSLRDYVVGDDLRHVDWKVSAKYEKLVIRKYTAPMSHPPLVIVDIPWNGSPYPEKAFNQMIAEVTGMVRHTLQTYQQVSVLMISGPNIIHLIREERSLPRCLSDLREWMHPAERPVHFYHTPDRSDLRSHIRVIENILPDETDPLKITFFEQLRNRYERVLENMRNPAFTGQVARALAQIAFSEAYLFSLECGDTSHIRHVVRPLRARNIIVHTRMIHALPDDPEAGPESPKTAGQGAPA
jgi:uncharacterized protein (DUF58 family)